MVAPASVDPPVPDGVYEHFLTGVGARCEARGLVPGVRRRLTILVIFRTKVCDKFGSFERLEDAMFKLFARLFHAE